VTKSTAYARNVAVLREVMDYDEDWGGVLDPVTGIRTGGFTIGAIDGVDGWSAAHGEGFGLTLAGLPLGDESYTQATLKTKTDKILENNLTISDLLRIASPQGLQAVCVYCCQSLLAYETQNLPPSVTIPHLKRLDKSLLEMMEVATRLDCLSGESLDPLILRRVRMPVSKRGVGLRSQEWVAPMAFAGGFLHAITAIQNMCPELGDWLHGPALHDDDRRAERLKFFTEESESPLRGAFTAAWSEMRERAGNPVLDTDDAHPLDYPAKSAGVLHGDLDLELIKEKFQREFTHQIEDVLFRQLSEDFKQLDWKDMRSAAFFVVGNYARQFINALPMMDTWCLGDELAEMYATYFGVPSPACAQYVGRRVGTRGDVALDAYGHALTSTRWLRGNGQKMRHDHFKWVLGRIMEVLNVTVEPLQYRGVTFF